MQKHIKKNDIKLLKDVYLELGCTKQAVSYWKNNPCSTHAHCAKSKRAVIQKASALFGLSEDEKEAMANKAGLSFCERENRLVKVLINYNGKYCDLLNEAAISERMFQYYKAGKEPTKQALLAIAISLKLPPCEIESLLNKYGYCLSRSLPNDAVVLWFLNNKRINKDGSLLLTCINDVLFEMDLPLLMTKFIDRFN